MFQQACGLSHDPSLAEDLVSETLVEAWRSLHRYNRTCRFSTWLFSILLHRHRKHLRRARSRPVPLATLPSPQADQRRQEQENLPTTEPSPAEEAMRHEAAERPKVRYPLAYEEGLFAPDWPRSFPVLSPAAHILCLRAVAELAQNQPDAAFQDTLLALRLADSLGQEPFESLHRDRVRMLGFCLQPVWEGLAQHRWNEQQLATLQQRFADMDLLLEFRVAVRGETLLMMNLADQFQAFREDRPSPWRRELSRAEGGERFLVWLARVAYPTGWLYQDKVWIYQFYERRADALKALDPAIRQQCPAEMRRAADPLLLIMVAPKLREIFDQSAVGALFLQTACQQAQVACALERFRLAQGQYPAALDVLVPAYLKQLPADLLDPQGAPLKYRREGSEGVVLYSIGLNRVDDDGQPSPAREHWHRSQPYQDPIPRLDEGDWVWRQP